MIYLDHNATSPLRPEAQDAMVAACAVAGNPSSVHAAGRAARAVLENARGAVAGLAGVAPANVIFSAGGTDADVMVLWGAVLADVSIRRLIISAVEHDAVLANAALVAEKCGLALDILPVTRDGVADLDALRSLLPTGGRALVALMSANNETGAVQPVTEAADMVHAAGGLIFSDAVAAVGKMPLPKADYLTIAGHKIGGPMGTGAVILGGDVPFAPLIRGGGQEGARRAGSENLIALAGFGAAAELTAKEMAGDGAGTVANATFRADFEQALQEVCDKAVIFSENVPRLGNTCLFAVPGMMAENALMALDLDGICVSRGAACSSGKVKSSHVLAAMNVPEELARCVLRISFGWNSAPGDGAAALAALSRFWQRVRALPGRAAA